MTESGPNGKAYGTIIKAVLAGWLLFTVGFALFMGADHVMRLRHDDLCRPGLPGFAYSIPAVLFFAAAILTYRKVPSVFPVWQRGLMVLIALGMIYSTYVMGILSYVMSVQTVERCEGPGRTP